VAALMLVSVLGVVFLPVSDADDDPVVVTDNLLNVGDAIGIGGSISFDDLLRIFSLDGGEDYVIDDEKIEKMLRDEGSLFPSTAPDLNNDGEIDDEEKSRHIQGIVFAVLSVLKEKLDLDLSLSASIYGMAEVVSKDGADYLIKVDAAARIDVSLGISLGVRPIEGTYFAEDLMLMSDLLLMSLFPDLSDELKDGLYEGFGGFIPTMFEDESIWVNLNAALALSASGYIYMTKEAEGPGFIINGILLDAKVGADLKATTNANVGVMFVPGDDEELAITVSYPGEVQTVGIRVGASASLECAFSATSETSVLPRISVCTEDAQTTLSFSGSGCMTYMHYDVFASAELYGNGQGMLAIIMGLLPSEFNTGNGLAVRMSGASFEDNTDCDPDEIIEFEISIGKNRLGVGGASFVEYDEESGKYALLGGGIKFFAADKDAPSIFSLLGTNSVILDGNGKSSIRGSVNSIRNNIPGVQDSFKIVFLNEEGVKLGKAITVTNGNKIPESAFPEFRYEDYVVVGWASAMSDPALSEIVTKDTVITHDMILFPLVAEDQSDDLGHLGSKQYWNPIYQLIEDEDYDFEAGDELSGHRYADLYKDGSLVCKWYFYFYEYDAENLKLNVKSGDTSAFAKDFGNRKMMLLKFDGSGEALNEAQVSVPVGNDFGSGLFAVYEIIDNKPVLRSYGRASNGMATFNIISFDDHLIVKLDVDPAASNVGTAADSSSNTLLYLGVGGAVAAIAIAGVVLFMRRP
ncbi:MAG: hypothetical protein GX137_06555, partial [Thermoplasmatales archaeon]|nr:hypothetical protein [Thermoplasmatales archaeon]